MSDKLTKLSQAIRLGATFRPQCHGTEYSLHPLGQITSCALGAAKEAVFGEDAIGDRLRLKQITSKWAAWLFDVCRIRDRENVQCPLCSHSVNVTWMVAHLNDHHRWTREKIADWLEGVGY